jgi:hypothetical protein
MNGFSLSAPDCGVSFLSSAPAESFCTKCSSFLANEFFLPLLDMSKIRLDFCFTYDNRLLVSESAKNYLETYASTPVGFRIVDPLSLYYACVADRVLMFDIERRKTRFEGKCDVCGGFESVAGATPAFLRPGSIVEANGFYRTDVFFGSGPEQSPLHIVGDQLKQRLELTFPELRFLALGLSTERV